MRLYMSCLFLLTSQNYCLKPFLSWQNSAQRYELSTIFDIHLLLLSSYNTRIIISAIQVRVSKDDLDKERGAVMEEYRGNRNASGRIQDAQWILMMEGSKVLLLIQFYFGLLQDSNF